MSMLTKTSDTFNHDRTLTAGLFFKERTKLWGHTHLSDQFVQERAEVIQRWRTDALLLDDLQYQASLEAAGLNEEQFGSLLLASADPNMTFSPQAKQAVSELIGMQEWQEALELNRSIPIQEGTALKLISAFRPFLLWAAKQWDTFIESREDVQNMVDTEALRERLIRELSECLLQIGARTLVLELHVAKQLEELEGDTPEDRFHSFVQKKLWDTDQLEFLYEEYPILARILMIRTRFIVDATIEAVGRFATDRDELITTIGLSADSGKLSDFAAGMGDAHQQGRSVIRMRMESGLQLVYKPKPLGASKHFSQFLHWMNNCGFSPAFKPMRVLDKNEYGWEEFIVQQGCNTTEEVQRYYGRLGGLLAVLYSMRGTDFHMENVIASGEHPTPIDLETVFHNIPALHFQDTADVEAKKKIVDSVIGTGLLPLLLYQNEEGFGVEMSGMGGGEQVLPFPVLQVEHDETDNMRFVRKSKSTKGSENVPSLGGQRTHAGQYVDEVVLGFRQACRILRENQQELLNPSISPLAAFRQDTVRIILRATQFYANFLMESGHPNYTKDALEREKLLDRLWYTVLDPRAIASEREDLMYGDVPYFVTKPDSLDLWDSRGKQIPGFFPETSYDLAMQRIIGLDQDEEDRQADWIVCSILGSADWRSEGSSCCSSSSREAANVNTGVVSKQSATPSTANQAEDFNSDSVFLEQASEIGDKLRREAIFSQGGHDATWVGIGMNYRGQWNAAAMKGGLYDGTAGPSIFLAHLGRLTGDARHTDLARLSMRTSIASLPYHASFGSAFYGQASVLYAIQHLSRLGLQEADWADKSALVLRNLRAAVSNDHCYDVLGGAAGIIPVLLDLYASSGSEEALDTAILYGDWLLEQAVPQAVGTGWRSALQNQQPLGGFAHGASGIAWALDRLATVTGNRRYIEVANSALSFERSLYSKETNNWADLRKASTQEQHQSHFWCHGSAGVGLSRLLLLQNQSTPDAAKLFGGREMLLEETNTAIQSSMAHGIGASHSLCHGDLSVQELLLQAGKTMGNTEHHAAARQLAGKIIADKHRTGSFRTGVPRGISTPGLFLGYSGIGYQLLRTIDPVSVPSVLTLELPPLS
ncbi:type 2 lanthipeptide synthetase LanM family protein [Saccharibacillus sp. JS10]|uniref:type 2 lanthipeptide synthetase LanM family protein n=1 Tax=Saccharibacillus sp. JS10 TaxID=2950552 RepID=UPI00210D178F|nr:type 2 lanthipeptide synthetase LanM family protein [Saccharibacillus sp. JS10]MCQ4087450.1 type 2 lanthipeptide synthetase LanM family protein [Saccharibacillus sp. JS10]